MPPQSRLQAGPQMRRSLRAHLRFGLALIVLTVGGIGGWAATTDISGAVIASGLVVVDSNVKKVQHPSGGIIGELRVRDGDRVQLGDVLVRLDETVTRANLAIISKNVNELLARKARLEAERDGDEEIRFPRELMESADVGRVMAGERTLFTLRRESRQGQAEQLRQRIVQLREEMLGHVAQEQAKAKEIEFISRELEGARDLFKKNLMPITKMTQLEREATRLGGERGQIMAARAQASGRIAEIELQIIQIGRDLASEVSRDLREADAKIGEFIERKVAAEDQLRRIEIRAPQSGMVHQLAVHTVGGVISAGDTMMVIVPEAEELSIEARVLPNEIDQIRIGQSAIVRFAAFNQRTTPELNGIVKRISADVTTDSRSGMSFYTIRIGLSQAEIARLGDVRLVPGMPVEAFMQTGERKVISYLVKPLSDQFAKAFRER
jgi:HlyD family secretion protein